MGILISFSSISPFHVGKILGSPALSDKVGYLRNDDLRGSSAIVDAPIGWLLSWFVCQGRDAQEPHFTHSRKLKPKNHAISVDEGYTLDETGTLALFLAMAPIHLAASAGMSRLWFAFFGATNVSAPDYTIYMLSYQAKIDGLREAGEIFFQWLSSIAIW